MKGRQPESKAQFTKRMAEGQQRKANAERRFPQPAPVTHAEVVAAAPRKLTLTRKAPPPAQTAKGVLTILAGKPPKPATAPTPTPTPTTD